MSADDSIQVAYIDPVTDEKQGLKAKGGSSTHKTGTKVKRAIEAVKSFFRG